MKFRIRYADQLVGVFLLLAVLAIAVILVFLGINQRWFAKDYQFAAGSTPPAASRWECRSCSKASRSGISSGSS